MSRVEKNNQISVVNKQIMPVLQNKKISLKEKIDLIKQSNFIEKDWLIGIMIACPNEGEIKEQLDRWIRQFTL